MLPATLTHTPAPGCCRLLRTPGGQLRASAAPPRLPGAPRRPLGTAASGRRRPARGAPEPGSLGAAGAPRPGPTPTLLLGLAPCSASSWMARACPPAAASDSGVLPLQSSLSTSATRRRRRRAAPASSWPTPSRVSSSSACAQARRERRERTGPGPPAAAAAHLPQDGLDLAHVAVEGRLPQPGPALPLLSPPPLGLLRRLPPPPRRLLLPPHQGHEGLRADRARETLPGPSARVLAPPRPRSQPHLPLQLLHLPLVVLLLPLTAGQLLPGPEPPEGALEDSGRSVLRSWPCGVGGEGLWGPGPLRAAVQQPPGPPAPGAPDLQVHTASGARTGLSTQPKARNVLKSTKAGAPRGLSRWRLRPLI